MNKLWETDLGGSIHAASWRQDGSQVLVGVDDAAWLLNAASGHKLKSFTPQPSGKAITALAVDRNGRAAMANLLSGVRLWDGNSGNVLWHRLEQATCTALAFSPDEKYLAAGLRESVCVFDEQGERAWVLETALGAALKCLAWDETGRYLAAGWENPSGGGRIWDLQTGQSVHELKAKNPIRHICLRNGEIVAFSAGKTVEVCWRPVGAKKDRAKSAFKEHDRPVNAIDFCCDGEIVASGATYNDPGGVRVWKASDGSGVFQTGKPHQVTVARFSPDGKNLVCSGSPTSLEMYAR